MDDLKQEYVLLFQGITETIVTLQDLALRLKRLQAAAEETYLERCDQEDAPSQGGPGH